MVPTAMEKSLLCFGILRGQVACYIRGPAAPHQLPILHVDSSDGYQS
jgi:hypothetical protein